MPLGWPMECACRRRVFRSKVLVLGLVELVELVPWIGRVELQVKRGGLGELLLVGGQPGQCVGEGGGD